MAGCFLALECNTIYLVEMRRIPFAILVFVVVAGCAANHAESAYSGILETDSYDYSAPFSAELAELRVFEGQAVHAGDTLAILDTVLVAAELHSAKAAVEVARAQLADLEAGSDKEKIRAAQAQVESAIAVEEQARRDLERAETLHKQGLIEDRAYEAARLALATATSSLEIAREQLADLKRGARIERISAARSALERAESELTARRKRYDDAFLVADYSGVVDLLPYQVGERIPPGRAVVTLKRPDSLYAMIYVSTLDIAVVSVGDTVDFSVDAAPGKNYLGQIVYLSSEAEFTPRNVQSPDERDNLVFAIKVVALPGQSGLRAGMPADFRLREH